VKPVWFLNFVLRKERDGETQLDYFGVPYYSNGLGRFITPDWAAKATAVPYAEFADPAGKPGTDETFSDNFGCLMTRLARVVAIDVPDHFTRRGNARQFILAPDAERMVYLDLLRQAVQLQGLSGIV
jgi:hypothetical protein